jgi:hypothetical protein
VCRAAELSARFEDLDSLVQMRDDLCQNADAAREVCVGLKRVEGATLREVGWLAHNVPAIRVSRRRAAFFLPLS